MDLFKTIKGTTGYGVAGVAGVGVYKGGSKSVKKQVQDEINKAIDQYLPEAKHGTVMGSGAVTTDATTTVGTKKTNKSRTDRNAIVKRVMMERGVSLPAASKIVKAENLYQK